MKTKKTVPLAILILVALLAIAAALYVDFTAKPERAILIEENYTPPVPSAATIENDLTPLPLPSKSGNEFP